MMDYSVNPPRKMPFGFCVARQIFIVLIVAGVLVCEEGGILFHARPWGRKDGLRAVGPRLGWRRLAMAWKQFCTEDI